jgi:hypothetical protein
MLGRALRTMALMPRPVYATPTLTIQIALSRCDVVVRLVGSALSITRSPECSALRTL